MSCTLKSKINRLIFGTLLSIGFLSVAAIYSYSQFRFRSLYEKEKEHLFSALENQTGSVLMTYLIPEQQSGLDLLLVKFSKDEGLEKVEIVDQSPAGFADCKPQMFPTHCLSSDRKSLGVLAPIKTDLKLYAYLFKRVKLDDSSQTTAAFMMLSVIVALFLAFLFLFFRIAQMTSVVIPASLEHILRWLDGVLSEDPKIKIPDLKYIEFSRLVTKMKEIVDRHKAQRQENIRLQNEKYQFQIAQQVAHDIRSPLAALTMVAPEIKSLPEDTRLLLLRAIQRIQDIANDLSGEKTLSTPLQVGIHQEPLNAHLLSTLIDSLVSEKRLQYRSRINVTIDANLGKDSYGLFAKIQPVEFKRVLSNLINNAIESLDGDGKIIVDLLSVDKKIVLKISDNGKGIPDHILSKLMQRGETHGKNHGSGLGLYHMNTNVQAWGGAASLQSEVGVGTTVTIILPSTQPPSWFVPNINIVQGMMIAVLDDDNSVHQVWKGRFESLEQGKNITVYHFSSPDEFQLWHQKQYELSNFLCLFDYEFCGATKNGLDIICDLKIQKHALLVTSHFEENDVRNRCAELGVRLIPKNLAGFVPIYSAEMI